MKKLIEIQAELKAPKNQRNNFGKYNYRSCEDILEAVKPLLKKHECTLTITDTIKEVGGLVFVEARAVLSQLPEKNVKHFDSNGIECVSCNDVEVKAQAGINPDRKGMDIAQSFGSSSSYARKYALNGLFLIDDTKDADATNDHGKLSQEPTPIRKPKAKPAKIVPMGERIKVEYGDKVFLAIVKAVTEGTGTIEQAKGKYNITQLVEDKIKEKVQALNPIISE